MFVSVDFAPASQIPMAAKGAVIADRVVDYWLWSARARADGVLSQRD